MSNLIKIVRVIEGVIIGVILFIFFFIILGSFVYTWTHPEVGSGDSPFQGMMMISSLLIFPILLGSYIILNLIEYIAVFFNKKKFTEQGSEIIKKEETDTHKSSRKITGIIVLLIIVILLFSSFLPDYRLYQQFLGWIAFIHVVFLSFSSFVWLYCSVKSMLYKI